MNTYETNRNEKQQEQKNEFKKLVFCLLSVVMKKVDRKQIGERIETLLRQKKITEHQQNHLLWIFEQEGNVKFTRDETRRLFRLDNYTDETIEKVSSFIETVEATISSSTTMVATTTDASTVTKQSTKSGAANTVDAQKKRRIINRLQRGATSKAAVERLPKIVVDVEYIKREREISDSAIISGWLSGQTKLSKAVKKISPTLFAPNGLATAMPLSIRVIPKKKKRKPRKKTVKKQKEEIEEVEEEEEEVEGEVEEEEEAGEQQEEVVEGAEEVEGEEEEVDDEEDVEDAPVGFEMEKEESGDDDDDEQNDSGQDEDGEEVEEEENDDDDVEGDDDDDEGGSSKKKRGGAGEDSEMELDGSSD